MKEYKVDYIGSAVQQQSKASLENFLNIAAIGDWALVCVSDGWAFYVRERRAAANSANDSKGEETPCG